MREMIAYFLEKEFRMSENIESIDILGRQGREVALVKLKDWKSKMDIMKEKSKLRKKRIFIDHDLMEEERAVQSLIRRRADKERREGRRVKIGYKKLDMIIGALFGKTI